jgi:(2Fe-2S) ferredoxin
MDTNKPSYPNYYRHHIFFCQNQRPDDAPRPCCANSGAEQAAKYVKNKVKTLGLSGPGKVRVNKAGCLERCEEGPCAVVYPEGVWYHFVDEHDLDEIVESHLKNGVPVARLRLPDVAA